MFDCRVAGSSTSTITCSCDGASPSPRLSGTADLLLLKHLSTNASSEYAIFCIQVGMRTGKNVGVVHVHLWTHAQSPFHVGYVHPPPDAYAYCDAHSDKCIYHHHICALPPIPCSHPLLYFPCFYMLKGIVEGRPLSDSMADCREHLWDNCKALWMIWVPAQMVNFTIVPLHLRIPFGRY